jgi:hypothetical protein
LNRRRRTKSKISALQQNRDNLDKSFVWFGVPDGI